jgi:uncharacterized SAM-binding protein YcdF (DUF218 family)
MMDDGEWTMTVLKSFATPVVWVLVLLVLGLVLTRQARRQRLFTVGRLLLLMSLALLLALSLKPVANFLTYPLESRYRQPSPEVLAKLDIVVVLGGGIYPSGGLRQEAELSEYAYPRLYHGVQVFKQSNAGLLAVCGGPSREGTESEGETMKAMAMSLGIPEEKILAETRSRDTFENAANLARLLPAGQGRRIGLVTSAIHMLRSHGVVARQFPQDTIVPIPVSYAYDPLDWRIKSFVPSAGNLEQSTIALHEWIGLPWYSLRGR